MAGITEKGQKPFIFIAVPQLRNTNGLGFVEKKKKKKKDINNYNADSNNNNNIAEALLNRRDSSICLPV